MVGHQFRLNNMINHINTAGDAGGNEGHKRDVFWVDKCMSPQKGLSRKKQGRIKSGGFIHDFFADGINANDSNLEGQKINEVVNCYFRRDWVLQVHIFLHLLLLVAIYIFLHEMELSLLLRLEKDLIFWLKTI